VSAARWIPSGDPGHRVLKLALRGTISGFRRKAKSFGEAPKGALKLVPLGAKSGLRSGVVAPSRLVTPSGGAGSRKSRAIWLQILFFVPSGTSSLHLSDVGLLLVGPVPIEGADL
jgi:hypothetical protein